VTSQQEFELRFSLLLTRIMLDKNDTRKLSARTGNTTAQIEQQLTNLALAENISEDAPHIAGVTIDEPVEAPHSNNKSGDSSSEEESDDFANEEEGDSEEGNDLAEEEPIPDKPEPRSNKSSKPELGLISTQLTCSLPRRPRIQEVFEELQTLKLEGKNSHVNAVAVLFRFFLEMLLNDLIVSKKHLTLVRDAQLENFESNTVNRIKSYLKSQHADLKASAFDEAKLRSVLKIRSPQDDTWTPSLGFLLVYVSNNAVDLIGVGDPHLIGAFQDYVNGKSTISHSQFNKFVHNRYSRPEAEVLRDFWKHIGPFILRILDVLAQQTTEIAETTETL
jgi:hypothetical protein